MYIVFEYRIENAPILWIRTRREGVLGLWGIDYGFEHAGESRRSVTMDSNMPEGVLGLWGK